MGNAIKQTVCALAVLATTSGSVLAAGESVEAKVIGTISAAACKPALSGGGVIDYGTISPSTLKKDAFTVLPKKTLSFTITCEAPVKLALTGTSGRGASAVKSDGTLAVIASDLNLGKDYLNGAIAGIGLGLDGKKGVGGFNISLGSARMDGALHSVIGSKDMTTWGYNTGSALFNGGKWYLSWSSYNATPIAASVISATFDVQAYINKPSALDWSKPVKLDGLATIELVYL